MLLLEEHGMFSRVGWEYWACCVFPVGAMCGTFWGHCTLHLGLRRVNKLERLLKHLIGLRHVNWRVLDACESLKTLARCSLFFISYWVLCERWVNFDAMQPRARQRTQVWLPFVDLQKCWRNTVCGSCGLRWVHTIGNKTSEWSSGLPQGFTASQKRGRKSCMKIPARQKLCFVVYGFWSCAVFRIRFFTYKNGKTLKRKIIRSVHITWK